MINKDLSLIWREQELILDNDSWERLIIDLGASLCVAPYINKNCEHMVLGSGNYQAAVIIVGEAPGATEDKLGLPFVGASGNLLDKFLQRANLTREQVYITNVLKCRPPNNRKPLPAEIMVCKPFLLREIALVKPQLIITLGTVAAQTILNTKASLATLRKHFHSWSRTRQAITVVNTYHPAYILRYPGNKVAANQDWDLIGEFIRNQFHLKT